MMKDQRIRHGMKLCFIFQMQIAKNLESKLDSSS
jgi:hypothetical protein